MASAACGAPVRLSCDSHMGRPHHLSRHHHSSAAQQQQLRGSEGGREQLRGSEGGASELSEAATAEQCRLWERQAELRVVPAAAFVT